MTESLYNKIIEFYETINVRHGVMIVGDYMSGKSTVLKILANALKRTYILEAE